MTMIARIRPVAIAVAAAVAGCGGRGGSARPTPAACTFTNPVAAGADPWVIRQGDAWYYVQARDRAIWIARSTTLVGVTRATPVRVWSAPDTGWNRTNIWAPELHDIDGRWYLYYAAGSDGPPFVHQRAGVLVANTDDPQGAWSDAGQLYTGDDLSSGSNNVWAIDLTVGRIGGQLYAIWSGWDRNQATDRTPQNLYIASMSSPTKISSNRVRIASPDQPWEKGTQLDLEEGPEFLQHAGNVFIIYSTRESWLPDYRLGELRLATPQSDPLRADSWIKNGPVFAGAADVHGVGHASFTTSADSSEDWIVYHSKRSTSPGWDRVVRMQRFSWNSDGTPRFGRPVADGQRLTVPSGDCASR
jgi:GH43 family beta-xylosidase